MQRFISSAPAEQVWSALSFDVRGAHKLVRVREDEQATLVLFLRGSGIFTALAFLDANGQHIGLPG